MRIRLALTAVVLMAALPGASDARAATEFGSECQANALAPANATVVNLTAPPGGMPVTAPSTGVITKVKINIPAPLPLTLPFTLKVLRSIGSNRFSVVRQASFNVATGVHVSDMRLPIEAGDSLGLHGDPFTYEGTSYPGIIVFCGSVEGAALGSTPGDVAPGATAEFVQAANAAVPLAAVVEPDADNDGYGDETQDKCPQSAAVQQVACPVIVLDSFPLAKKRSIVVLVASSVAGPVSVAGTAKLPKAGGSAKLKKVTKEVAPGTVARFTLKLPASLRSALRTLPRGKSVTVRLTATAANVAGMVSTDKAKVKLKR